MTERHRARLWSHPLAFVPVIWICWLVFAPLVGPRLVEAAWGGRVPVLSSMIAGRSVHGLQLYLDLWKAFALRVTIALGIGTVLILIGYRYRARLLPGLRAIVRPIAVPTAIGFREVTLLALWTGLVLGLIEAGRIGVLRFATSNPRLNFFAEMLWATPLATSLILILYGLLLGAAVLVIVRDRATLRVVPALLAIIGIYSVIRSFGGIHPAGALVLAIGITVGVFRLIRSAPARGAGFVRRSGIAMASVLLLYGVGYASIARLHEARAIGALPVAESGSYNVLFLILDTVRAQDLSVYGYERPTTPNLERFARRGTVFEHAWAPAPWTLPSHASMFTGIPSFRLSANYMTRLDDEPATLAEVLTRSGYATGGFVGNYYFAGRPTGLARGFIHYEGRIVRPDFVATSAWLPRRILTRWKNLLDDRSRLITKTAADVNRAFLDWLPSTKGHPFFAFINYIDAHDPYAPPEPWNSRWAGPGTRYSYGFHEEYTPAILQQFRDHYDGGIAYIDAQIGQLLDELDRQGRLDSTLVVIASDHGEEIGEHGPALVRHGWSLYSPSLRVPLILILPGVVPEGARFQTPVSTAELAPTVADLATPSPSPGLPGRSLRRFWTDSWEHSPFGAPIISAVTLNPSEAPPSSSPIRHGPMTAIVEDRFHYILNGDGRGELYDVVADPWEMHDLSWTPAFSRTGKDLRQKLLSAIAEEQDAEPARRRY